MLFFPDSSEIISQIISPKKVKKSKKSGVKLNGNSRRYLSEKDYIRNTYGYGKIEGDIKLGSKRGKSEKIEIVKGGKLKGGLRRFLSYHGKTTHLVRFNEGVPEDKPVDFDSLQGKYLLICCFNVPIPSLSEDAKNCRAVIDAYNDIGLHADRPFKFEMVVVANMRTDVDYNRKAAFKHFYSAFSCLAIPFSDFETHDYIYSCMSRNPETDHGLAILVDPEGIILQNGQTFDKFVYYGSEGAPFLPSTLEAIDSQDELLRSKLDPMYSKLYIDNNTVDKDRQQPLTLHDDILLCSPLRMLRRFDDSNIHLSATVLELSCTHVGLYLCIDGSNMEEIMKAHNHCLEHNQQLEIVLVCMPFYDEPTLYYKELREALTLLNIKSWFIFDYNSRSCRRLWRIFGQGCLWPNGEKFIIIPPGCKSGELCGREVITNFGVDQYPFTRTAILKQRLEYFRSLTPVFSSLFNSGLIHNGKEIKSEQLQGKNVLLYLSWGECDIYNLVKEHYPDIKAMGWEVVFVLLRYTDRYWNKEMVDPVICMKCPCFNFKEMPWPFMLPSAAAEGKAAIKDKLFFPEDDKTGYLFAVGKDGSIVSRDVADRLETDGVTESLFDDVLASDFAYVLADIPLFEH